MPVLAPFEAFQRLVQICEVLARPCDQGCHMGAFEGGAGSLGVVLVVNGDQGIRRDDRVEVAAQRRVRARVSARSAARRAWAAANAVSYSS